MSPRSDEKFEIVIESDELSLSVTLLVARVERKRMSGGTCGGVEAEGALIMRLRWRMSRRGKTNYATEWKENKKLHDDDARQEFP